MKLQFKNQAFQEAATAAVCDVFEGQPYHDPNKYTVDPGLKREDFPRRDAEAQSLPGLEVSSQWTLDLSDDPPDVGYKNAEIELPAAVLLKNLQEVQDRQNLEHSNLRASAPLREIKHAIARIEAEELNFWLKSCGFIDRESYPLARRTRSTMSHTKRSRHTATF